MRTPVVLLHVLVVVEVRTRMPGLPGLKPRDAVWQPVGDTSKKFFVYSSFLDLRDVLWIIVVGITASRGPDPVLCYFWLKDRRSFLLEAKIQPLQDHGDEPYSGVLVLCSFDNMGIKPGEAVGGAVSVVARDRGAGHIPTNLMAVQSTVKNWANYEGNFVICPKPINKATSVRANWLIEWLEMNHLLGVAGILVYHHTSKPSVECVLKDYSTRGFVKLMSWELPFTDEEVGSLGHEVSLQDCLYRVMPAAEWLVNVDMNELILPRQSLTLHSLIRSLELKFHDEDVVSYEFRNVFFYSAWRNDERAPEPLHTAKKTMRMRKPAYLDGRRKYIVRARNATMLGVHQVWRGMTSAKPTVVAVGTDHALLHHYKDQCSKEDQSACEEVPIIDRTAHKWSKTLMGRVNKVYNTLLDSCAL